MAVKVVKFKQDVYPHVKGDVHKVDDAELKRVDQVAKDRKLSGAVYEEVKTDK